MAEERYFWTFDRTIFDQIRLPELTWKEGVLIVLALLGFVGYFFLVRFLDYRTQLRIRRAKEAARLERWLEHADLSERELDVVHRLAGGESRQALFHLFNDTVRFETRVHQANLEGWGDELELIPTLRTQLGHHSENLRAPIVSTRQFEPGDPVRLTLWEGGLPHHHYGTVEDVGQASFGVQLREQAIKAARLNAGEMELYYLRGFDTEYRFSCRVAPEMPKNGVLSLSHVLISIGHRPREVRLPLLRDIEYQFVSPQVDEVSALDPSQADSAPLAGVLFDLSEGGFSILTDRPAPDGRYIRFSLPLKKGRHELTLTGKVQQCREFSGNQWLVRCMARDISPHQRIYLQQIVRVEHKRRLRTLAPVRRISRRGEDHAQSSRPS